MAPPPKKLHLLVLAAALAMLSAPLASLAERNYNYNYNYNNNGNGGGAGFFGKPWFGPTPGSAGWASWVRGGAAGKGAGSGLPGGYARQGGAAMKPSTVCMEEGPCHKKQLTCPDKCFRSFSYKDKNGGGGGGGGGCSFDCTTRCVAFC